MERDEEVLPQVPVPSRVESMDVEDVDDLYDLIEEDVLDLPFEYGFNSDTEMLEYIKGEGRYSDRNSMYEEGHSDAVQDQRENMAWYKCPTCEEKVDQVMSEEGVSRSQVDRNTTYSFRVLEDKHGDDDREDKKKYAIWCDDHGDIEGEEGERGEFIWFEHPIDML